MCDIRNFWNDASGNKNTNEIDIENKLYTKYKFILNANIVY